MRSDLVVFRGAALEDDRLTRADLLVLWHIGRHADFKTGWAHPSLQTLVKATGRTKRTVLKAIGRLVECGYLICRHTARENGTAGPNHYLILLDPADARTTPRNPIETPAPAAEPSVPGYTPDKNGSVPAPSEPYTTVVSASPEAVYQGGIPPSSAESTRNTHLTPTRTPIAGSGVKVGGWPAEFAKILSDGFGDFNPGRVGRVLRGPVERVGIERAREVVSAYARFGPHMGSDGSPHPHINAPQYCSPEKLAQTWKFWMDYTEPMPSLVRA